MEKKGKWNEIGKGREGRGWEEEDGDKTEVAESGECWFDLLTFIFIVQKEI